MLLAGGGKDWGRSRRVVGVELDVEELGQVLDAESVLSALRLPGDTPWPTLACQLVI